MIVLLFQNFGFVIFNSPEPVKQILIDKVISTNKLQKSEFFFEIKAESILFLTTNYFHIILTWV